MNLRTIVLTLGILLVMSYDPRTGITTHRDAEDSAAASDPAPSTATSLDVSPFLAYLQYAGGSGDVANSLITSGGDNGIDGGMSWASVDPNWLTNPQGLFDIGYNAGSRRSLNPYYSTQNRDALRDVAERLGLSPADADRAALDLAQQHFNQFGQGYSDATHPSIIADDIARQLFAQAGMDYSGLSPEQTAQYVSDATLFQNRNKEADQDAWKRDDFGGMLGAWTEQIQNALESDTNEGWLPSEQALLGADNPWNTWLINTVFNKEYDPLGNEVALPTEKNYQQASDQGYDVGAAGFLNEVAKQAILQYLGAAGLTGDLTFGIGGGGAGEAAGGADAAASGGADATGAFDQGLFAPQDMGLNPAASNGLLSASYAFAKKFALNLALSGGDYKAALKQTLLDTGVKYGASAAAGLGNSAPSDLPADTTPVEPDFKRRGMLALGDTGTTSDVTPGLFDADVLDRSLIGPDAGAALGSGSVYAADPSMFNADILDRSLIGPLAGATLDSGSMYASDAPLFDADALDRSLIGPDSGAAYGSGSQFAPPLSPLNGPGPSEQPTMTPEQQRAQENAKMTEQFAKYARVLAQMNDDEGEPQDAPRRQEGQDDAQYSQTLAQYANLDAQAMADAGLTPGTPEYYEYIMKQMDSIISQITDGLDPDDATLSDRLRAKTREELDSLERALYVRGQIGQLMGSGRYTDPFTGIGEDVIAPEGRTFQPGVAAYHRGLARSADEIAAMRPQEARRFLGGMLDRNPDLYGMEASANDRALEEMLASQGYDYGYDWKRRRGMLSGR